MADSKHDPRHLVESNYDKIASNYLKWINEKEDETPRLAYLEKLLSYMPNPSSASVLEIGCGAGIPGTQELAKRCRRVVANDISQTQVALARTHVTSKNVDFIHGDISAQNFPSASFDGVIGFYSIFHLPRDDQRSLFKQIAGWLKPGGYLLCNLSVLNIASAIDDWLGGTMFWSGWDAETHAKIIHDAGLTVLENQIISESEDGRTIPFQWLLARKD
jgi:SAM-dependent methyltransferase